MTESRPLKVIEDRIPKGWWKFADIGKGWHQLVIDLDKTLAEIDPEYEVHQVKEKFGTLRYYANRKSVPYTGSDWTKDPFFKAIGEAEAASEQICEDCGAPGELRQGGWLRTLCDEHAGDRPPIPPLTQSVIPLFWDTDEEDDIE